MRVRSRNPKRRGDAKAEQPMHAVLIHIPYEDFHPDTKLPSEVSFVRRMHELQDRLAEAILAAGAGELDGDEFGEGECTIYTYGPDADRLWEAMEPMLVGHAGFAIKRYGEPGEGREVRVEFN